MKTTRDPRHIKRKKLLKDIFTYGFNHPNQQKKRTKTLPLFNSISKIDALIEKAAPQFPVDKIAKIDVAILRLSIYELLFEKKQPPKVIIDEAVELAKEFGGEGSPLFINGVLGTLYKEKYGGN